MKPTFPKTTNTKNKSAICPACRSKRTGFSFKSADKDYSLSGFRYYTCRGCNGYFLHPIPSVQQLDRFYSDQKLNQASQQTPEDLRKHYLNPARLKGDHAVYLEPLLKYKRSGRLLDFACGSGWFVHLAARYGFEASGIDFDKNLINAGSQVFQGDLRYGDHVSLSSLKPKIYDVISLFSILEHVTDPTAMLRSVWQALRPGGILMIVVPTVDSLQFQMLQSNYYWFMAPYHINLFSYQGLEKMLARERFKILEKRDIQRNWYWTKAIVDKLGLLEQYRKWREQPEFVNFDIEVDRIFDEIAFTFGKSSAMMLICKKLL